MTSNTIKPDDPEGENEETTFSNKSNQQNTFKLEEPEEENEE